MKALFGVRTVPAKAIAVAVILIIVNVAVCTAFLLNHFGLVLGTDRLKQNLTAAELIINPKHEAYSIVDGTLRVGERKLAGDYSGVDAVVSAFGGVATIFQGDKRIATNVKKANGTRAVGTKLAAGPVYDAVLHQGREYFGEAKILNKPYVAAYEPIKDASGNIIGVLFVGFDKSEFGKTFMNAVAIAIVAGLIQVLLCAGIGSFIFRKLFAPFGPLSRLMEEARSGRYTQDVPFTDREDEFGELARVIQMFNKTMKEQEALRENHIKVVVSSFGEALAALARRDLTYRLDHDLPQEYRVLQEDLNTAISQLETAMKEIDKRAGDMATSSEEITHAAQEMAQRTERQAAALEETSAALNELNSAVGKSVDGAKHANDAAAHAKTNAETGSAVAKNAVEAIRLVAKSSGEITQIIGVINEIAFQTNLLALNAGVEAARAGDAGRGFAVVASEVRSLAQRSAEASKQIKHLITTSEEQVENGVKMVEESGGAFSKIVGDISTIYELVTAIASSQREQATSLGEIDSAINQMDQTTQQNAAMAEESCAASEALAGFARELAGRVGEFKTSGGGTNRPSQRNARATALAA
jgi:methyl-accepting chemotaxis protein